VRVGVTVTVLADEPEMDGLGGRSLWERLLMALSLARDMRLRRCVQRWVARAS
jgi:hypothetical protein